MENRAAKRREKGDDDAVGSDRISQLPEAVLLHMLCFLSQKKAVQTSVLSKSWRYLGPARPVIDLHRNCALHLYMYSAAVCENCFKGNNEAFISALDKTFQRYHDQNLFTQEIDLQMFCPDSQSISVLEKWIPIFINPDKPGVTKFRLSLSIGPCFYLPSVALKAESLRELDLFMCRIGSIDKVVLKNLQKLSLSRVDVSDEALEKIISGCPLVKCVVFNQCEGFKTISIGYKNHHLNRFKYSSSFYGRNTSIEIDAPTLESINIVEYSNWYHSLNNYFPNLKSLFLSRVKLPTESFANFSCNFPLLEELKLEHCCGFEEIKLYSCSMRRLIIQSRSSIKKVALEVPNILYFEFSNIYLPTTFSLTTTSTDWKSNLNLLHCVYYKGDDVLSRILQLFEMVKALSQSQISLTLSENFYLKKMKQIKWDFNDHPVAVEHLSLHIRKLCPYLHTHFLNVLLRIFRPLYISAVRRDYNDDKEVVTELLWRTLIHKRVKAEYGWNQHLKEVSIEAFDRNGIVWHHVQWCRLPEGSTNQKIRFRLKWRGLEDY